MDLINQMAETQKVQEVKLDELKNSVGRLQEELESARAGRNRAEHLLADAQDVAKDVEERYHRAMEESRQAKETYAREMDTAKKQWNSMEIELKTTYEEMVVEMRRLEDKNSQLESELAITTERLTRSQQNLTHSSAEMEKYKQLAEDRCTDLSNVQSENEKNCNELHNCKMQLLKERNINDRLLDEVRRLKKDLEGRSQQVEEVKKEKDYLSCRVEELVRMASKERLLEIELKELRMSTNMILLGNNSIDEKLSTLGSLLRGETISVSVQTDMTNSDLDQYENLDRQAALMMMGLKEQLLTVKQQHLESRQENEALREFVAEVKRDREVKEDGERMGRLEETVKSLSDLLRREMSEPSRESCILQALHEVKNDVSALKARNRFTRTAKQAVQQAANNPISLTGQTDDPANRPVKLVTFRNGRL